MEIFKELNLVQLAFKFAGVAPFNATTKNKNIWEYFNLILTPFLNLCISLYIYFYPIFDSSVQIHGLINTVSIICLCLTVLSGNCQCHYYKLTYHNINYGIQEIVKDAKKNFSLEFTKKLTSQYRRKVYLILIIFAVSQVLLLYEVWIVSGFMSSWSSIFTTIL